MHRFNAISRNVNTINWKIFPTHVETYNSEKIQQAFWRDKTKGVLRNMKGCIPEAEGQGW